MYSDPIQQQYQRQAMLPTITSTVLVTAFFGLFGLIPAVGNSNRARALGAATNKYWKAFWITLAANALVWVLIAVAAANSANSYNNQVNQQISQLNYCMDNTTIDADGNVYTPPGC